MPENHRGPGFFETRCITENLINSNVAKGTVVLQVKKRLLKSNVRDFYLLRMNYRL